MKEKIIKDYALFIAFFEICFFMAISVFLFSTENEILINELIDLGLFYDKSFSLTFYAAVIIFYISFYQILIKFKKDFFIKNLVLIKTISFLILTICVLLIKEVTLYEEHKFLESKNKPLNENVYREIYASLTDLKKEVLNSNNEEIKAQYAKVLETINAIDYPITEFEYRKFLKEKNIFYELNKDYTLKAEYEKIKNFH